ncbi:NUDIX hydrolase [Thermodesulfobacteriota bacterium]
MQNHKNLPYEIKELLNSRRRQEIEPASDALTRAAVLIPLFREDDEYKVLLTKRTNQVETHKGQISFPGGAVEDDDGSYQDTALREADEEIGLQRKDVTILGRIDDALTLVSQFIIYPFVGLIPHPYDFEISHEEVDRIISVPLNVFFVDHPPVKKDTIEIDGITYQSPNWEYGDDIIWGATARIMDNFVNIIAEKIA